MTYGDPTRFDSMLMPLCRRYLHLLCGQIEVLVQTGNSCSSKEAVLWAVGVLTDGQTELAGAWPQPESRESGWRDLFEALHSRGVEQIRFIVSANSHELLSAMGVRYQNTIVIDTFSKASAIGALNANDRSALIAGYKFGQSFQRIASRAAIRHAPVAHVDAAVSIVTEAFRRAEQRRDELLCRTVTSGLAGGRLARLHSLRGQSVVSIAC